MKKIISTKLETFIPTNSLKTLEKKAPDAKIKSEILDEAFNKCYPSEYYTKQYETSFAAKIKKQSTFAFKKLVCLDIPNFDKTNENGVRGESLLTKNNRGFISKIKEAGIRQIIDLKTSDHSPVAKELCNNIGIEYNHFPIDAAVTSDKEIIENLPKFFDAINKGNFYISCAQGLHRTDIALSLNYVFNPNASDVPPFLKGHINSKGFRCDDVCRRINSIMQNLTSEDKAKIGLPEDCEKLLTERKKALLDYNSRAAKEMS